jgi:hypothetical protein
MLEEKLMNPPRKRFRLGAAARILTVVLAATSPSSPAFARMTPPAAVLSKPTIRSLQEALGRQGIVVKVDGSLSEETHAGILTGRRSA